MSYTKVTDSLPGDYEDVNVKIAIFTGKSISHKYAVAFLDDDGFWLDRWGGEDIDHTWDDGSYVKVVSWQPFEKDSNV